MLFRIYIQNLHYTKLKKVVINIVTILVEYKVLLFYLKIFLLGFKEKGKSNFNYLKNHHLKILESHPTKKILYE